MPSRDYLYIFSLGYSLTLENHCIRTVQSSRGSCSRQVLRIVYLAVNKGNVLVICFTSENIHRELLSLINPAVYLLNIFFRGLSDCRYRKEFNLVLLFQISCCLHWMISLWHLLIIQYLEHSLYLIHIPGMLQVSQHQKEQLYYLPSI